jgi:tetratricopeptide (TPR) repeat protein
MKKKKDKRSQKSEPPHSVPTRADLTGSIRKAFKLHDTTLSPILKKSLISLMLVLLFAGVVSYKINLLSGLPHFDPENGQGFFWTESAFHYRHFLIIAQGGKIPAVDYDIQYPEGLDTVRYITPVMEYVAGFIYRLSFSNMPPHLFAVYFAMIFSTLSVLAIFLAGKVAWRSNTIAFLCAVIYGFALASLARSAGGGYIREDFALPFIFFSFACFLYCLRQDRPLVAALGSFLLVIAFFAWHVTQLYLSLFAAALAVVYLLGPDKGLPRKSMLVFVAFMLAASFLIPVLRAKYFIVSPALMLSYALLALTWFGLREDNSNRSSTMAAGLVILGFLAASLVIQGYLGTYSHVYALLSYKLKFLGVLPQDSGSLPFEAKVMWASAFVSPKLTELPLMLASSLVFGPIGAGIILFRWFKKEACTYELMIALLAVWMFIFFLMIHRMSVFAIFFLALSMGALTRIKKSTVRYALYAGLGAAFIIQMYLQPSISLLTFRPPLNDVNSLISFIKSQSEKNTAVLSTFELGPAVAAYTGRPVILHSKFESKVLRDKVNQVYTALYQSEQQFFELCRRLKAGLFVYQVKMVLSGAPGSIRYLTNAIPLKTDSAAFMFHFLPDRLRHFSLVYQNPTYRLYRIGAPQSAAVPPVQYEPVYDLAIFSDEENLGNLISDGFIEEGLSKLRYPETHLKVGDRFFASEDYKTAARQYQRALMLNPGNKQAAWSLARALILMGEADRSEKVLRAAVAMDPDYDATTLDISDADALILLGREALQKKQLKKSVILFQKALEDKPGSEPAHFGSGSALRAGNKLADAESAFQRVVAINPENHQAFENLAKIYAVRGDLENAVACIQKSLELNPSQPNLENIYHQLQNRLAAKKATEADFDFYFKSGNQKARQGELQAAIDLLLKAAELKKTGPLMYNLGLVSHRLKKDEEALAYLKESLAMNPTDMKAKSLLKYILHHRINAVSIDAESKIY